MVRCLVLGGAFWVLCISAWSFGASAKIDFDKNSPKALGSGKWAATGTFDIPKNSGSNTYDVTQVELEYQKTGSSWIKVQANFNKTSKTWSYTTNNPQTSGTYYIKPRLVWVHVTGGFPPTSTTNSTYTEIEIGQDLFGNPIYQDYWWVDVF